ncbi:MAG TPA: peptidylprolyl isomerase, partial [Flavisolibacter sp.]|nr:peptidylprolyl isomerase [Flavisolibacter sp.]
MKKLFVLLTTLVSISVSAQTLFYYGNDSVSTKEFLKAYYKNNSGQRNEKVFNDYLQLYINSRLKIKEAKSLGYDTLSQIQAELENLRQQIIPTYLNDKQSVKRLEDEAFQRSQKDIHLAHIYISFTKAGKYDTAAAGGKLLQVLKKIKVNTDFGEVAKLYSDDPSAALNNGDMGYITVFDLPYDLENLAYNLKVGEV